MKKKKRYLIGFGVLILVAGLLWHQQRKHFFISEIERPDAANGIQNVTLSVYGVEKRPVEVELPVAPARLPEAELENLFEESWQQTLEMLPGENESLLQVEKPLVLTGSLSNGVLIEWYSSDVSLVDWEGQVNGANPAGTPVTLMATLHFQGEERYKTQDVVVYPAILPETVQNKKTVLEELLQAGEDSAEKSSVVLPATIGEREVSYHRENGEVKPVTVLMLGSLILFLLALTEKTKEKEAGEKRKKQLQMDYSELVTLLTIYLGAGLSIRNAWSVIVQEYAASGRACYEEMAVTERAMKAGCFEGQAYQEFGRRTQVTAYIRLGNLLAQNLKKGPKSLLGTLEAERNEAFEERKRIARRQGEEAGTKLMMPMFLLFGVILLYIMVPVMMSLSF